MRSVTAARREIGEERLLGVRCADRMQPLDRLLGHGVGQVVGVLLVVEGLRGPDDLLVLGQAGVPLARPPAEEPIEIVEPPADGPAVERSGRALLAVRRQVPLAERRGAVAVVAQDPRERNAVVRNERRIAREPGRELADRTEANRVAVAPGEKRRTRGRAERRDVEAVIPHPSLRDPRVVRRVDRTTEGSGISEARVVDQDQQDVRRAIGCIDVADCLPVRTRAVESPVCHPAERLPSDRELASIRLAHDVMSPLPSRSRNVVACTGGCSATLHPHAGLIREHATCSPG